MPTPRDYAEHLKLIGGTNHLGEPRFILWHPPEYNPRIVFPPPYHAPYDGYWTLCDYHGRKDFGLESEWLYEDWGAFPYTGGYLPLQRFGGAEPCQLDSEVLNKDVLSLWVWVTLKHEHDSIEKRTKMFKEVQDERRAKEIEHMARKLEDCCPAFGTAAASGYGPKNNAVEQKIEEMEKYMKNVWDFKRRFPKNLSIQATPSPLAQEANVLWSPR